MSMMMMASASLGNQPGPCLPSPGPGPHSHDMGSPFSDAPCARSERPWGKISARGYPCGASNAQPHHRTVSAMIAIDTVLTKQLTALRLISRVKSPLSKQRHTPDDHGDGDDESDHATS